MKKFDSYTTYTAFVRLAQEPKTFDGKDKDGKPREDVSLTFADNSRFHEEVLWVDAVVGPWHNNVAKQLKKGDAVQISGKLRLKKMDDGNYRGKIYNATLATFANFGRESDNAGDIVDPVPPAFE